MKKIKILFGEMGAGKNYWGNFLNEVSPQLIFFDGDTVAPPEMVEKVSKFKPLNKELIDQYIDILIQQIIIRADKSPDGLIVAQALYLDANRKTIQSVLETFGYDVDFYWVKAPFWRNMKQLFSRPKGLRWVFYWLLNKPFFQKPTHIYILIDS